ncbi:MAG: helix-turn-helix domain-containing protein [Candidatus Dadabacteria bacterium]|nr:helix-turn-helix domain-containing protein [Candidatus Dadabacteria bacterium]
MQTDSNLTPELLTPDELATMLKISKAGVYRLVEKRRIPFHKVTRSVRFDKKDILSFLQQNRIESVSSQYYGSKKD